MLIFSSLNAQYSFSQLDSLIKEHHALSQYDSALIYAQKAMKIAKTSANDSLHLTASLNLGWIYDYTGKYEAAEPLLKEARKLALKIHGKNNYHYAVVIQRLADYYLNQSDLVQAESLYLEAQSIFKATIGKEDYRYASVVNALAELYYYKANFKKAIPLAKEALAIRKRVLGENDIDYAISLNNLAAMYWQLGYYDEVEGWFKKAIHITEKNYGKRTSEYAAALNNLAFLYVNTQQYQRAIPLYEEALEIEKEVTDSLHPNYALKLENLASAYGMLKNYSKAKILHEKALNIKEQVLGKENKDYAVSLGNLSELHFAVGDYDKAENYQNQCLEILEKKFGKTHPAIAKELSNLGELYFEWRKFQQAQSCFEEAYQIHQQILGAEHPQTIHGLNNLALWAIEQANFTTADSLLQLALTANLKHPLHTDDWLGNLAQAKFKHFEPLMETLKRYHQLFSAQGRLQQQQAIAIAALHIGQQARASLQLDQDRLLLLSNMQAWTNAALHSSKQLYDQQKIKAEVLLALAEQNKSVLLLDALKSQQARSVHQIPDSLLAKEKALATALQDVQKAQIQAHSADEKAALNEQLTELDLEISAFKSKIQRDYPAYYQFKYTSNQVDLNEIQAQLKEGQLFLEYYQSDSLLYLFAIHKNYHHIWTQKLPVAQFNAWIKDFRKALSDYKYINEAEEEAYDLYVETACQLYEVLLLKQVKKLEAIDELIIVADAQLSHIPFEALLTQKPNSPNYTELPYFFREYAISYNYSGAYWLESLKQKALKAPSKLSILGIAGSYQNNNLEELTSRAARAPHLRNLRETLGDLPAARQEVEQLSKQYQGVFWLDSVAVEGNFKKQASEYGVIHLAMHGLLNQQYPILSSLAFTENGDTSEDNFLQAYEIAGLDLQAELVVLSACETGYGKFERGEGVMSLARAFMYAGVPSLVVSLWQVNDESTSIIMQHFYKALSAGQSKAEALRQAKIHYLDEVSDSNPLAAHPAFWAAFIQLGDASPVALQAKSGVGSLWWWLGGAAAILLVLFIGWSLGKKK